MNEPDGSGVKSADRALTILELFSAPDIRLTFTEVAQRLGFPRSSLHGLLHTMKDRGWLRFDAASRCYALGIRAWETGSSYRPAVELAERARGVLPGLAGRAEGDAHIAVLDGLDCVCISDTDGATGRRLPAHSIASGKVLLAALDTAMLDRRLRGQSLRRVTERTTRDVDALRRELDGVRAQGFAEDHAEHEDGRCSLAVAVTAGDGAPELAVAVVGPASFLDGERRERALSALRDAARDLGAALVGAAGD